MHNTNDILVAAIKGFLGSLSTITPATSIYTPILAESIGLVVPNQTTSLLEQKINKLELIVDKLIKRVPRIRINMNIIQEKIDTILKASNSEYAIILKKILEDKYQPINKLSLENKSYFILLLLERFTRRNTQINGEITTELLLEGYFYLLDINSLVVLQNKDDIFFMIARQYSLINEHAKAIKYYLKSIELEYVNTALCYLNIGNRLQALGNIDLAKNAWITSIQLNDTQCNAYLNLGNTLLDEGNRDEAYKYLKFYVDFINNHNDSVDYNEVIFNNAKIFVNEYTHLD